MLVTLYVPFYTSLTHYLTKWLIYSITIIVSLPYVQSEFVSIYFPRYKVTTRMCNAWRTVVVHRFIIYLFLINLFFILLSFPCLRKCCANIWLRYVSQWFSGCWYRPLSARNAGPGQIKTANASIYRKSGRVCCSDTLCRAREHTAFVRVLSLSFSLLSLVSNTTGKERERERTTTSENGRRAAYQRRHRKKTTLRICVKYFWVFRYEGVIGVDIRRPLYPFLHYLDFLLSSATFAWPCCLIDFKIAISRR